MHDKLLSTNPAYAAWHAWKKSSLFHWVAFLLIALGTTAALLGDINPRSGTNLAADASLSQANNPPDLVMPPASSTQPIPGYILVKYKDNTTFAERSKIRKVNDLSVKDVRPYPGLVVAEAIPAGENPATVAQDVQYANPATVEYATAEYPHYVLNTTPNDPSFGSQWGLQDINAPAGWDISTGSPSVIVAVVDTGADWNHPELAGKLVPGTCLGSSTLCSAIPNTQDVGGVSHGTHNACNIAANTNNSLGIAGVSWNAKVMPIKVCDGPSGSCPGDIDGGIIWAAQHGAKVISLSIGGGWLTTSDVNAIKFAYDAGAVVVAAAGNNLPSGVQASGFLADVNKYVGGNHVLIVAATDRNNNKASWSDYGPDVDVAAPGVSILSCQIGGGFRTLSGTSMATPTVAGLAALVFSVNPKLTNQQVIDLITKNAGAGDGSIQGGAQSIGTGVINVARTLAAAKATLGPPDLSPPTVPTGLTGAASGGHQINLSWTASTDDVSVAGYSIIRDGGYVGFTSGTNYSDAGLTDGTTYTYALIARDTSGNESATSTSITVTTPDVTPPTIPTGLTATPSASSITLTWLASSDAVGVTGYRVYRDNVLLATTSPTTLSYVDSAVSLGQTHTYYVTAFDAAGNASAASAAVTSALADTVAPTAPSGLSGNTPDSQHVNLAWSASADNVGVTGYNIYRGGVWLASSPTTNYVDASTTPGTTYTYTVKAYDAAGNISAASNAVSVTVPFVPDTTPPSTPSNLSATATTSTQVVLAWRASADNVGVKGYDIFRGGVQVATTVGHTYLDATVAPGTTYVYSVKAYDAAGNISGASNSASATTPAAPDTTAPSAPANLVGVAPDSQHVNLAWSVSSDNIGVTGYNIYRAGVWLASSPTNAYADTAVVANTTYVYTVKAYDAAGNISAASNSATVKVPAVVAPPDTTPPSAPTNLTATIAEGRVKLSWSASADNVGVTGYTILRAGSPVGSASGTTFFDTGVVAGQSYSYTVKAYDAAGNISGASNAASITVPANIPPPAPDTRPPSAPANLSVVSTASTASGGNPTSSAKLSWSASSDNVGVVGYKVYRGDSQIATSTGTSYSDAGPLTSGATYSYSVRAYDAAGNVSGPSNIVSLAISAAVVPLSITGNTITGKTATSATVVVTTSIPSAGKLLYFKIGPSSNTAAYWLVYDKVIGTSHTFSLGQLVASSTYGYYVTATTSATTVQTSSVQFTTPAAGGAVSQAIQISWQSLLAAPAAAINWVSGLF